MRPTNDENLPPRIWRPGFEPLCQANEIGIMAAAGPAKLGLLAALVLAKRAHRREQKEDDDDVIEPDQECRDDSASSGLATSVCIPKSALSLSSFYIKRLDPF